MITKKHINPLNQQKQVEVPENIALRLSDVVKKMFSSTDFHYVDMRSIAKEASMSFTTIYRYFQNKERLLFWFISYWIEPLNQEAKKVLQMQGSVYDVLKERLRIHLRFYENNPDIGRVIFLTVPLERWMQDETFAYREPSKALLLFIQKSQDRGELRQDMPAVSILDAYNATFNRTFLMWEYRKRSYTLQSQLDNVFTILWDGIKKQCS